jgi:hypothetical protein
VLLMARCTRLSPGESQDTTRTALSGAWHGNRRLKGNPPKIMNHYHLTSSDGIFTLTRDGSSKVLGEFQSKSAALNGSAKIMIGHKSSLQIHKKDGSVASERTFPRYQTDTSEEADRWEEEPMPGIAPYTFK